MGMKPGPGKAKTIGRKVKAPKPAAEAPTKTLGRKTAGQSTAPSKALARTAEAGGAVKTLGRKGQLDKPAKAAKEKTIGRGSKGTPASDLLTRALVREKIADRLSGKLSPEGLASWARAQFLEVQRGAPAESGYQDMLEDSLQTLTLSTMPVSRLTDEQLVDMMTQLDE